jgi:hypothetical protein
MLSDVANSFCERIFPLSATEAFPLMLIPFFYIFFSHVSRKEKYFHKFSPLPLYIISDIRIRRKREILNLLFKLDLFDKFVESRTNKKQIYRHFRLVNHDGFEIMKYFGFVFELLRVFWAHFCQCGV